MPNAAAAAVFAYEKNADSQPRVDAVGTHNQQLHRPAIDLPMVLSNHSYRRLHLTISFLLPSFFKITQYSSANFYTFFFLFFFLLLCEFVYLKTFHFLFACNYLHRETLSILIYTLVSQFMRIDLRSFINWKEK